MRETEFIVIGSGIAGLRAAVELGRAGSVLILTKDELTESSTRYAQGGVAVALSDDDEIALHFEDTLRAGAGLCDPEAVRVLVEEGPHYVQELIEWGCRFDRTGDRLEFGREAAHSRRRIVHARGDATGREIVRTLLERLHDLPDVEILPHAFALRLLIQEGTCVGVQYVDTRARTSHTVRAHAVILTTGGAGHIYAQTTNPDVVTGEGMAMAYEAGALLADMEFVQFHPTALHWEGAPRFLLSEALRGEGGVLRNRFGERFMPRYHEQAELAPRDVVARAIVSELQRTQAACVYLDLTHLPSHFLRERFPRIYETCRRYGLDLTREWIPVSPAAHYFMGGVRTDLDGWTGIAGLFAAGEVSCTGVHGANRLASNSLLEGLVFGARAARRALATPPASTPAPLTWPELNPEEAVIDRAIAERIRTLMWEAVGLIRHGDALRSAINELERLRMTAPTLAARHIATVAWLVARAALFREESRGAHFRADFPTPDDAHWRCHSIQHRDRGIFTHPIGTEVFSQ
ncbi:MAG: L-aspartate oxidase [Acidobacteriota bacterium]|nr:L-aspartate oxidase [Acidobacteriota bacterium]